MFLGAKKISHTYLPGTPFASPALDAVSFSLARGSLGLLLGASGSGKTTLLQHLNGLLRPSAGAVFFAGRVVRDEGKSLLRLRRRVGLVFQIPEEQFFCDSLFDEVAFAPRSLGLGPERVEKRVRDALDMVGLDGEELLLRHPFTLSSGQKRLAALAAILALKPAVLLLDEPTAALDSSARLRLVRLLATLRSARGLTVLVATHHPAHFAALADTVMVMAQGRMHLQGSPGEVFAHGSRLEELGLALPEVTAIMHELAHRGLPVRRDIFCLDQARRELGKLRGGERP